MGIFDRIRRAIEKAADLVTEKPAAKTERAPPRAPAFSQAPKKTAADERAELAAEMGTDDRERAVGGKLEKENWFAALRARADRFAPGLLDALEEALDGLDPDDDILSDTEYETDKGKSP